MLFRNQGASLLRQSIKVTEETGDLKPEKLRTNSKFKVITKFTDLEIGKPSTVNNHL